MNATRRDTDRYDSNLEPHPEGGYYREIFRSALPGRRRSTDAVRAPRSRLSTTCCRGGAVSRWHRVTSDEVWHLYEGGPLEVLELDAGLRPAHAPPAGRGSQAPVRTIAAGHWQFAHATVERIRTDGLHGEPRCSISPISRCSRTKQAARRARALDVAGSCFAHLRAEPESKQGRVDGAGKLLKLPREWPPASPNQNLTTMRWAGWLSPK